jgi:hypothetical protein
MKKLPIVLFLLAALLALSFLTEGPCDSPVVGGHTGAPGETGCDGCHGGAPNTGPGTLTLDWSDTSGHYVPGQVYDAVVTLEQADRDKFGFVALALKDSGNTTTGQFSIDDADRTRTYNDGPRKYVSHTPCGADAAPLGSLSWTFHWQAPATDVGAVTIYLAGLAANHNHATSGDDAYELALHLTPADSVASASGERFGEVQFFLHPNPVSAGGQLNVRLTLPRAGRLEFRLLDNSGRAVRSFDLGEKATGNQMFELETAGLAAGVYFLEARLSGEWLGAARVVVE